MKLRKNLFLTMTLLALPLWTASCSSLTEKPSESAPLSNTSPDSSTLPVTNSGAMSDGSSRQTEAAASTPLDDSANMPLPFTCPDMIPPQLMKACQDYIALTESYMEDSIFEYTHNDQVKSISQLLTGHYEVVGREDHNGREYYLALRRTDAPSYDDFNSLSIGYLNIDTCQIGYYNKESDETILYHIDDYLVTALTDEEGQESLDMLCLIPRALSDDSGFSYAFTEHGRLQLDFIHSHTGLSLHQDGKPCIDFYYQDEDTIQFWSEPYLCCIPLDSQDCNNLVSLLSTPANPDGGEIPFEYPNQILDYVRTIDSSIRTTGARFTLEDTTYELLGSQNNAKYLMSYHQSDLGKTDLSLIENQPVFSYIVHKIKPVVGLDYGTFTDTWFDLPLTSASLDFPRLETGEDGSLSFRTESQTIVEPEKLAQLSNLLSKAIHGHEVLSGCPYTGTLVLTREDGETLRMFIATDSCDSITYEGRIGFEYGSQKELSNIFDKAIPSWE